MSHPSGETSASLRYRKKWCLDANVVAQEKGIEAILAIAEYSGESLAKCRSDVVPSLVEKGLGSVRQGTKKKASDLCAMFVEIENNGDGVIVSYCVAGADPSPMYWSA